MIMTLTPVPPFSRAVATTPQYRPARETTKQNDYNEIKWAKLSTSSNTQAMQIIIKRM